MTKRAHAHQGPRHQADDATLGRAPTLDELASAAGGTIKFVQKLARPPTGWRLNLTIGADRCGAGTCPAPQHQGVELHTITMRQHDQRGVFIKCSMGHSAEHVLRAILGRSRSETGKKNPRRCRPPGGMDGASAEAIISASDEANPVVEVDGG